MAMLPAMDRKLALKISGLMLIFIMAGLAGCNKSDDPIQPVTYPSAASLLGLNRTHQLDYIIFDSLVTIWPESVTVVHDTTNITIGITRGTGNQVELTIDGSPQALLLTDQLGVIHSGQIRPQAIPPDTIRYLPTPLLVPNQFHTGTAWSYSTPDFAGTGGDEKKTVLYLNHGYRTVRDFYGTELILLPSGSYDTYHFRSHLFLGEDLADTAMVVDEYFAQDIGPVKIVARFGLSQRLIILLDDH